MKIAVVVLAGGEGRRIGGAKPMQPLGGMSLLDRALRYARRLGDTVAVAVRDDRQIGSPDVTIVRDDPAIEGPLGGLAAGLRFARDEGADAVLTLPTDMPFLPSDLADRLRQTLPPNRAAIASSGGRLHPVCGLWLTGALYLLPDYLASGRRSLNGFAQVVGYSAFDWPVEPVDPFFNINSAEDLTAAERLLRC